MAQVQVEPLLAHLAAVVVGHFHQGELVAMELSTLVAQAAQAAQALLAQQEITLIFMQDKIKQHQAAGVAVAQRVALKGLPEVLVLGHKQQAVVAQAVPVLQACQQLSTVVLPLVVLVMELKRQQVLAAQAQVVLGASGQA